jgi:hypothetical protein
MSVHSRRLMIFGIGKVGGQVADVLAARYPHHEFILVSRSLERSALRANLVRYVCSQWGQYPAVLAAQTNLLDVTQTSALIAEHRPDVVFNATTPFPWWAMDRFPPAMRKLTYSAGLGMWCALDCLLPLRLGEAIAESGLSPTYVNACYPDMVNTFLRDAVSPPLLGIGNMSNLIPGLQLAYAQILGVDPRMVTVRLVAHHFTSLNAPTIGGAGGAPYRLSISHPGGELTFTDPIDTPFTELKARASRVRGLEGQAVTVTSAATLLATLLQGERRQHHVPGPLGLPGGYPVVLAEDGAVQLDLPLGLTIAEAVSINERAQYFDGLSTVHPGKVELTDTARDALRTIVGVLLPTVTPTNVEELAAEVVAGLNMRYDFGLAI